MTRVNDRFRSCSLHRRLGRGEVRGRLELRRGAQLRLRLADELLATSDLRALELRVGVRELARARPRPAALALRELGGVGPRVDDEQELALLDDCRRPRKCTDWIAPDTRGRTSTESTASKRPE